MAAQAGPARRDPGRDDPRSLPRRSTTPTAATVPPGVAARCVYVEIDGQYPRLRICDWQVAARPRNGATATNTAISPGAASLAEHIEKSAGPYLAPELGSPDAQAAQLDIFGLGTLSYLILTGPLRPAARPGEAADGATRPGAVLRL